MNLIPFAGKTTRTALKRENVYFKFRAGADTMQLANHYRCSEATILKWVNIERSHRLGLPVPYGRAA